MNRHYQILKSQILMSSIYIENACESLVAYD